MNLKNIIYDNNILKKKNVRPGVVETPPQLHKNCVLTVTLQAH